VLSQRMAMSAVVRGGRSALPPREALILIAVINHPWLLATHAEELAELEFNHGDADMLRRAILDAGAGHEVIESGALRAAIAARGLGTLLARIEGALTHMSDWPARPDAAPGDVGPWWTHIIALHRKTRTLNKELKDAERALGEDPNEQNLARLRDVQAQLADLNGSEAQIDGFGALSGRPARNL
jgi:DNA primase